MSAGKPTYDINGLNGILSASMGSRRRLSAQPQQIINKNNEASFLALKRLEAEGKLPPHVSFNVEVLEEER